MPNNCGGCSPVEVPVNPPCVDCPPPPPECHNGETCEDIYPAACVEYQDENLPNIGVVKGDRLNNILRHFNLNTGTQAISTQDTVTVDLTGSGLGSTPLKADVKLSGVDTNLIKVATDGLVVSVDTCMVRDILAVINGDEESKALFCEIVSTCSGGFCGPATNMTVVYTAPNFVLTWTPFNSSNAVDQVVQIKKLSASLWTDVATLSATATTYTAGALLANTLYQFRVQTDCYRGGPSFNSVGVQVGYLCPTSTVIPTDSTASISFPYVPSDMTKFTITVKKTAGGAVAGTYSVDLLANPALSVSHLFTGLEPETNYTVEILMSDSTTAYNHTCTSTFTTTAAPVCDIPQGLNLQ